ncbi:hypothetical protein, partial [Escherichia coli]|uniref:hypothetical protein n=1 Tax=Escherichia coli TaxID=562 RepID=UPI001BFC1108
NGSCRMVVRLAVIVQILCCVCAGVRFNTACEYQRIVTDLRIRPGWRCMNRQRRNAPTARKPNA